MATERHRSAAYKIIPSQSGNRYSFFCELSGMLVCTTETYCADDPAEELSAAWEEGRKNFNYCHMCGRWVDSIVYNPDVLWCAWIAFLSKRRQNTANTAEPEQKTAITSAPYAEKSVIRRDR